MAEQDYVDVVVDEEVDGEEAGASLRTQDERLVTYLTARLEECVQYRENVLIGRLERLWEIYAPAPKYAQKNWPWENASNLSIASAATYVDQFVAKHVNALRSPTPVPGSKGAGERRWRASTLGLL